MNRQAGLLPITNPFATRYVRPGALHYIFPPAQNATSLAARLAAHGWRGEIVGPHGSGKSTLLAALRPALVAADRMLLWCELHDGQRRLPVEVYNAAGVGSETLIVVDGYEQLSWLARWRLAGHCQRYACGLLVTAHGPVGLPALARTCVTLPTAERLVERLQAGGPRLVRRDDVERALTSASHDLREALFRLYDLFERRRRAGLLPASIARTAGLESPPLRQF